MVNSWISLARLQTMMNLIVALFCGVSTVPAVAQNAEEFYKAHPKLTLGVPAGAGGTYDTYTRLLSRYLPKYIPGNPTIVVQNITAAGGLGLANETYNTAPKDGTFLAMVRGSTVQENVNGNPAAMFDGRKFAWIGNMNQEYDSCIVMSDSPLRSISDLYSHELIVGASGAGAQSYSFPLVYNEVLHMKFKVVTGYPGSPDRLLAMQRGELTGNCGIDTSVVLSTFSEQYRQGNIRVLLQAALYKDQRFADVPNILDEAKAEPDRQALAYMFATLQLGRTFATAGETPRDRVALLRQAFAQAVADPGLVAEAKTMQLDLNTMDGDASAAAVNRLYATPRAVIDRVQAVTNANP
jgi:tripartite-type tricarboxylate transporter receptor subunit TctC